MTFSEYLTKNETAKAYASLSGGGFAYTNNQQIIDYRNQLTDISNQLIVSNQANSVLIDEMKKQTLLYRSQAGK